MSVHEAVASRQLLSSSLILPGKEKADGFPRKLCCDLLC